MRSPTAPRPWQRSPRRASIRCGQYPDVGRCNDALGLMKTKTPPFQAGLASRPWRGWLFLDLDLVLHRRVEAADVIVDSGIGEGQLGGLALQRDGRALRFGASDRDLVRRGIGVVPADGLALADDDSLRSEFEVGDRDDAGARRGLCHGA